MIFEENVIDTGTILPTSRNVCKLIIRSSILKNNIEAVMDFTAVLGGSQVQVLTLKNI